MDSSSIVNKLYAELQRQENQIDAWSRSQKEEVQRSQRQHIDFAKEADSTFHKNSITAPFQRQTIRKYTLFSLVDSKRSFPACSQNQAPSQKREEIAVGY